MRLPFAFALLTACAAFAPMAAAQEQAVLEGRFVEQLLTRDANGDGQISRAEIDRQRIVAFERADLDQDGVISSAEVQQIKRRDRGQGRAFDNLDLNDDGAVTTEEYKSRMFQWFERFDANQDDVLDAAEIEAARQTARTAAGG